MSVSKLQTPKNAASCFPTSLLAAAGTPQEERAQLQVGGQGSGRRCPPEPSDQGGGWERSSSGAGELESSGRPHRRVARFGP
jgi:hypothetical protein